MQYKKALIVGIDDYPAIPLRGCTNDADRISNILSGESCGFTVKKLLNQEATRSAFRAEVRWLLTNADVSVLYFAGHGARTDDSTYLLTADTAPNDEGIEIYSLTNIINKLSAPNQTVIIILDCCHSGDATPRGASAAPEPLIPNDIPSLPGVGRIMLAACRGHEVAVECVVDNKHYGVFTHHLCEALTGNAADDNGNVTVNAAYDYVVTQLSANARQIPVMKGDQEGAVTLATGTTRRGAWAPTGTNNLTTEDAVNRAEEMLNQVHMQMAQGSSISIWNNSGFASACRAFEPVLAWFRRRIASQPNLLSEPRFKEQFDTCQHFLARLCSVSESTKLINGTIAPRVGSGSFGIVWRIAGGNWTEPVCFKAFHPHDLNDREKVTRFRRGFDAMQQLEHPNIVRVLQLSELPFGFFMQYVDGPNLRKFNPGASLEPDQIVDLLIGAAETIKHAHGRGVIHRDVKPENILVLHQEDGSVEPYLTDFDLAWFSAATQVTQVAGFGSHYYAAPEQMDSPMAAHAHKTPVDTYSFGQLSFFALCGRDPMAFNHDGNVRAFSDELSRKWHDSTAAQEMLHLFRDCTKFKPTERVQDFREISDRLARIRALLAQAGDNYDAKKFLEQTRFNLGGDLKSTAVTPPTTSLRSRSGRTEINITLLRDAKLSCALDVALRPNELIMDGLKSSDARLLIIQRIDAMLSGYAKQHSTERRGGKGGGFEISIRIDHLSKDMPGVLKAREIISKAVDTIEQA